jgi:hypothetical protein
MAICVNCGAHLSCGCQRRNASDGKQCCDGCLEAYERKLKTPPPQQIQPPQNEQR